MYCRSCATLSPPPSPTHIEEYLSVSKSSRVYNVIHYPKISLSIVKYKEPKPKPKPQFFEEVEYLKTLKPNLYEIINLYYKQNSSII